MKHPKFEVYKASDGYRWRLKATNGKIIAESGEALTKKPNRTYVWSVVSKFVASDLLYCGIVVKP